MTLAARITAFVQAVAADVKALTTALAGKVSSTDERLSNARDWNAEVVPEVEAKGGEETTARKWTAQRVRQAITGWWSGIGTAFGKSLLSLTDSASGRAVLGLENVNNTSDLEKPISTATANALNAKFDKTGGWISGAVLLERTDDVSEGGEISFARASDNVVAFAIDVAGLGTQPNLRIINVANENALVPLTIIGSNGAVLATTTGGLGYGPGAGGSVVQPTSKTTTVTLNKPCGTINTHNSEIPAQGRVFFLVNNTTITSADVANVCFLSLQDIDYSQYSIESIIAYQSDGITPIGFYVVIRNMTNVPLSQHLWLIFNIVKGSNK